MTPSGPKLMTLDTICIELTSRCPMRCVHCSACAAPTRSEMMDAGALIRGLAARPRLCEIYLSGGEPFEHPALEAIAATAVERADRVVLYSSGATSHARALCPLDETRLTDLAQRGIARIDISLYSAHAEVHDSITATPGSLTVALESCRRIRASGLALGIHFVPLPGVDDRLREIDGLCRSLGASLMHVLAPTRQGRGARLGSSTLSDAFLADLLSLRATDTPYELVISSAIRARLGLDRSTLRDQWNTGFVDVRGRLHRGEGHRLPLWHATTPAFLGSIEQTVLFP